MDITLHQAATDFHIFGPKLLVHSGRDAVQNYDSNANLRRLIN